MYNLTKARLKAKLEAIAITAGVVCAVSFFLTVIVIGIKAVYIILTY